MAVINNQQVCGLVFQLLPVVKEGFFGGEFTSPENKEMHLLCVCKHWRGSTAKM